jgi:hypothetical protein
MSIDATGIKRNTNAVDPFREKQRADREQQDQDDMLAEVYAITKKMPLKQRVQLLYSAAYNMDVTEIVATLKAPIDDVARIVDKIEEEITAASKDLSPEQKRRAIAMQIVDLKRNIATTQNAYDRNKDEKLLGHINKCNERLTALQRLDVGRPEETEEQLSFDTVLASKISKLDVDQLAELRRRLK